MEKGKLVSFEIKNFGPFAKEFKFYTSADMSKKELIKTNCFEVKEKKYNKVSFIYGANGAGKSNFCNAIVQLQKLLIFSPIFSSNNSNILESIKNQDMNWENPFLFDVDFTEKPTTFIIEILLRGIIYNYSFSTFNGKIISEKLTKKNKRVETILERTSPSYLDIILKSEFKKFESNVSVVKENALCLSLAQFLNIDLANELVNTILNIKVLNMASINKFHGNENNCTSEKLQKYLQIIKKADPTIKNINVSFDEKQEERKKLNVTDIEDKELVFKKVKVNITSTHNVYNGNVAEESKTFNFTEIESMGTIKLFGILPVIFDALDTGGVIVVDEIDNGLHPNIVKNIISLFNDAVSNPLNAQLIVTSHCKELIEKNTRRDQVWIISKNERGMSTIKRISDIPGMRAYEENGVKYLKDAFGNDGYNTIKFI